MIDTIPFAHKALMVGLVFIVLYLIEYWVSGQDDDDDLR